MTRKIEVLVDWDNYVGRKFASSGHISRVLDELEYIAVRFGVEQGWFLGVAPPADLAAIARIRLYRVWKGRYVGATESAMIQDIQASLLQRPPGRRSDNVAITFECAKTLSAGAGSPEEGRIGPYYQLEEGECVQKLVDTMIVADAIFLGTATAADVVLIVSEDGDMAAAVQTLWTIRADEKVGLRAAEPIWYRPREGGRGHIAKSLSAGIIVAGGDRL
jgi:hypothetical protein